MARLRQRAFVAVGTLAFIAGVTGAVTRGSGEASAATAGHPLRVQAQDAVPPEVTPARIAHGDSIFRGKAGGGTCFTCHQPNAKGIPGLAPDLTDKTWLHGDGSYAFIVQIIQKGVPKPKQAAAPMIPRGGTSLSDEQIRAVAAYVYSLRTARK